jgi:hypothetical protein
MTEWRALHQGPRELTRRLCGETDGFNETWTGSPFTRDPYVGDLFNNETDQVSKDC